jgi:hypothetical protein
MKKYKNHKKINWKIVLRLNQLKRLEKKDLNFEASSISLVSCSGKSPTLKPTTDLRDSSPGTSCSGNSFRIQPSKDPPYLEDKTAFR